MKKPRETFERFGYRLLKRNTKGSDNSPSECTGGSCIYQAVRAIIRRFVNECRVMFAAGGSSNFPYEHLPTMEPRGEALKRARE